MKIPTKVSIPQTGSHAQGEIFAQRPGGGFTASTSNPEKVLEIALTVDTTPNPKNARIIKARAVRAGIQSFFSFLWFHTNFAPAEIFSLHHLIFFQIHFTIAMTFPQHHFRIFSGLWFFSCHQSMPTMTKTTKPKSTNP